MAQPSLADINPGMEADTPTDGSTALKGPEPDHVEQLTRWANSINIATEGLDEDGAGESDISSEALITLGMRVKREYEIDETSRAGWKEKTEEAMKLAMQQTEPKNYPWPKAANVIFPLMTTAAMQFAARAYPAIVMGREIVKGVVIGQDNGIPQIDPQTNQPAIQPGPVNPQTGQPT